MSGIAKIPQSLMEQWNPILENVSEGKTLKTQATKKLPYREMLELIKTYPELAEAYELAQQAAADHAVDELMFITDEPVRPGLTSPEASAWAARQKLRVESRKWYASKLSRKWSEKTIVEQTNYNIDIKGLLEKREEKLLTIQPV